MDKRPRRQTKIDFSFHIDEEDDVDVITPSEESSDYSEPSSPSKVIATVPRILLLQQKPSKKQPPYYATRTVDAVYAKMEARVKDQPALYNIAATISAAINRSLLDEESENSKEPKLVKLLVSGVSGCGKTECVLATQEVLDIGPGTGNEEQVVFLDGSTLCSDTQVSAITGAAAGLAGYRDGHSIADRLNRAIRKPGPTKKLSPFQQQLALSNPSTQKKKKAEPAPPYVPPRFIMLVIDELDKVHPDLLKAINGLIETGNYAVPNGSISFVKPPQTTMFILFTCNYGDAEIASMAVRDDFVAENHIVEHMRYCNVPPYTIGRLGDIYPFYPVERAVLFELLAKRLEAFIKKTALVMTYTKNREVDVTPEAIRMVVDGALQRIRSDLGVRGAMKQLLKGVNVLFEKAYGVLGDAIRSGLVDPTEDCLQVTGYRFAGRDFEEIDQHEEKVILQSVLDNPANRQALALSRSKPDAEIEIQVMGVRIGKYQLCHFVLPPLLSQPPLVTPLTDMASQLDELKKKIDQVKALATSTTSTNRDVLVKTLQEITGVGPVIDNNKRKASEDLLLNLPKKAKLTREGASKRGCKAREIEGFTPIEYLVSAKRYLYECNDCKHPVDSRKIGSHQCII